MLKDLRLATTEVLSPQRYLALSPQEKANISQAKIIPPVLGEKDFGKIQVDYKFPLYKIF